MSIAISAVVLPSVRPRCLLAVFGLVSLACGALLASAGAAYAWNAAGAGASLMAGLFLLLAAASRPNPRHLDISGVGHMRLAVYLEGGGDHPRADADSVPVRLLPGSTLWPGLLLLLLIDGQGRRAVLAVWPDSAGGEVFRALAVACRAVAARQTGME